MVKLSTSFATGGSTLSSYGTIAHTNNYSLLTMNRIILTYLYSGNGIFQTAIEQPILDALSKGIEIDSREMSSDDIDALLEWMETPTNDQIENPTPWETLKHFWIWNDLYGGAGILINTNQEPHKPLDISNLQNTPIEFYDVDRWQMDTFAYSHLDEFNNEEDREFYYINGVKFHKSRIMRAKGKKAPYYIRRQLRGWGLAKGEKMIRDLNLYFKTQDVLYEIIDESKVDIYKIKGFANKLMQRGGTETIHNRVMMANQIKNYVNALIMDLEDQYESKTLSFAGLAEVMRENRIGVASSLRMPMTKLFGLSASGFNTGESDLENYNSMVESEVRTPIRPYIRMMLEIGCSKLFGYIPSFTFNYPSLRVLSAIDEESIFSSQQQRAMALYDRGLINSYEIAQMGQKQGWLEMETMAGNNMLPPQPTPPSTGEEISQLSGPKSSGGLMKPKEEGLD